MPTNTAAWIPAKHARLQVGPAPYPTPGAEQVVVRTRAVAINPLDWIIQVEGTLNLGWLRYPTVLGSDVAGEVVEVGAAVTRFQVGDRVLGHAVGSDKDTNNPAEGAFQHHTVLLERMTAPIPAAMSYEDAAVLPLGVSTAASGLFQTTHLGLRHPSADATPTGETLLVWGGSTSVGSNAVQLAVAAGYEVVTTASPRNAAYVRGLGASEVFDHHSATVVPDIIEAFSGRTLAGAIAMGETGAASCVRIAGRVPGKRFVAVATPPVSFARLGDDDRRRTEHLRVGARLVGTNVALQVGARSRRVRVRYIFGTSLKSNEVGTAVYRDHLPQALASGRHVAAPRPTVIGHGLQDLQHAMDLQRAGVSATKLVVTLAD